MTEGFISSDDAAPNPRWTGGPQARRKRCRASQARSPRTRASPATATRPHPLLVMVAREDFVVLLTPSAVWENGRDLLKPFTERFAESHGAARSLGSPGRTSISSKRSTAASPAWWRQRLRPRTSCSSPCTRAFELIESEGPRREPRQGAEPLRYELGELIDIARAMTTERDVEQAPRRHPREEPLRHRRRRRQHLRRREATTPNPSPAHAPLQALAERLGALTTRASS